MNLLAELKDYSARHGVKPSKVACAATGLPQLAKWLETGTPVAALTLYKLRHFLEANPAGLPRQAKRDSKRNVGHSLDAQHAQRVDRDPCTWCGVRKDLGCDHYPRPADAFEVRH